AAPRSKASDPRVPAEFFAERNRHAVDEQPDLRRKMAAGGMNDMDRDRSRLRGDSPEALATGTWQGAQAVFDNEGRWRLPGSRERASDPAPILDRVLLAGHDLDGDLAVAGIGESRDALFQLSLGCSECREPDQFGGDKRTLLGLYEHQVPAVIHQIRRIRGLEMPCR